MKNVFLILCVFLCGVAQAANLYAFGDSITVGVNAPYPYVSPAAAYHKKTLVNKGVSGSQITGQATQIYATSFNSGDASVWLTGYNDMRFHGAEVASYTESLRALLAWMGTGTKVTAKAMTRAGSWSATPAYGIGLYTTSPGASVSATVTGSVIYLGSIQQTSTIGSFKVTVDGVDYGPYQTQGGALHANSINYNPFLIRIPVSDGPHLVTVSQVSGQIFIDWVGAASPAAKVFVAGCLKMPAASYALGAPFNKGSDTYADNYTAAIQSVVSELAADGLRILYVPMDYDVSMISSDGVHPNETGHIHMGVSFINAMP